jgi:hypothetical protein
VVRAGRVDSFRSSQDAATVGERLTAVVIALQARPKSFELLTLSFVVWHIALDPMPAE